MKIEKVLLVTNIPNPYRLPLFNELGRGFSEKGIRFKVAFAAPGYRKRKWQVDMKELRVEHSFLEPSQLPLGKSGKAFFFYKGLGGLIKKEKPGAVIVGGFSLATVRLWLLSLVNKLPFIVWSGAIDTRGRKDSLPRRLFRKVISRRAAGFIAYGEKAKEYLCRLGVPPAKITIAINTTDTGFYNRETARLREKNPAEKSKNLLYVGHLTRKKRIDLLLAAVKELLQGGRDVDLVLVGDGPERENLEGMTRELSIAERVSFEGFKQKLEIPAYLARADCFCFPSEYDIWGLALLEALAAGVPCVSSIHAGATHDLIEEGKTGFAVDFCDTKIVVERIAWLLDHPSEAKHMGQAAAAFIRDHAGITHSTRGFYRALGMVQSRLDNKKQNKGI